MSTIRTTKTSRTSMFGSVARLLLVLTSLIVATTAQEELVELQETSKLLYSDDLVLGDRFGRSVALKGDLLYVGGGRGNLSWVDIFKRRQLGNGSVGWTRQTTLAHEEMRFGNDIGSSLIVTDNMLLLGAPRDGFVLIPRIRGGPLRVETRVGAIYVYTKDTEEEDWALSQKLLPNAPPSTAILMGTVMAVYNNELLVAGAPTQSSRAGNGSVYVFRRHGGGASSLWQEQVQLTPRKRIMYDTVEFVQFGTSVALSEDGTTLFVGARGGTGIVYVFDYDMDDGVWVETDKLIPDEAYGFGAALLFRENTLFVGVEFASPPGDVASSTGAVFVYTKRSGKGRWQNTDQLFSSDATMYGLGSQLAMNDGGDRLVAGAARYRGSTFEEGASVVFARTDDSGEWTELAKLTASDADIRNRFGQAVAVQDNLVVVGGNFVDEDTSLRAGAVYVFELEDDDGGDDAPTSAPAECGFYLYDATVVPATQLTKLESDQDEAYNLHDYSVKAHDISVEYVSCSADAPKSVSFWVNPQDENQRKACERLLPYTITGNDGEEYSKWDANPFMDEMTIQAIEHTDSRCSNLEDIYVEEITFSLIDNPCPRDLSSVRVKFNCESCGTDGTVAMIVDASNESTVWAESGRLRDGRKERLRACIPPGACAKITLQDFSGGEDWDYEISLNGITVVETDQSTMDGAVQQLVGHCNA